MMQTPAPAVDEFRAGVTACLRSWSALKTAVESGWGGDESYTKAEYLRQHIVQHFDFTTFPPRNFTTDDLEDHLAIYLEDEFSVVLEDASERQVADTIFRMYHECFHGSTTLAWQMVQSAETARVMAASYPSQIQSMEHDDDDDDSDGAVEEDEDDCNDDQMDTEPEVTAASNTLASSSTLQVGVAVTLTSAREYAAQPLFGSGTNAKKKQQTEQVPVRQLGEPVPEPSNGPTIDEDGFATVPSKRRNNRKAT